MARRNTEALARLSQVAWLGLQVAAAYSEDKARQGGDLGWKSRVRIQSLNIGKS